jgi:hypothetical protein
MLLRFKLAILLFTGFLQFTYVQSQSVDHWESVVYASDTWRYYVGITSGPNTGWQNPDFDDTSWPQGQGGFGYGDGDDLTAIPVPPNPTAVFTRIVFEISDTSQINAAVLSMDFDDGFVAWINGVEVARANLGTPGDLPAYDTPALDHEAVMWQGQNPPSFLISKEILRNCLINGSNILSVQVNNTSITSSDMSCLAWLSVGLKTTGTSYKPVPTWFTEPYAGFTGSHLPLVIVETNGTTITSEVKVMVDFGIIDNGSEKLNYLTDEWNGYNGKAGIEYRGSSSMMFPKKNFGLETRTPAGDDSAVSLLGMPKESDWVLHGPYSDKSLVRNFLAYDLARNMGHYAPRTKFCEMFIDGQYQGVYVMLEKIKRDSSRVAISKLETDYVSGHALTGGYIIKIDRSADGSYTDGWFSPFIGTGNSSQGPFFAYHYPKWQDIVQKQKDYIRQKITTFELALQGAQYRDPYIGYRAFIDVNSFIDYFILVEMSKNTDGFRLSTFLHKDRDDRDPLIHMGPVWDYDLAFGNANYLDAFNTYGWNYIIPSDGWGTPFWWSKLISDPYFANLLNCRWHSLRQDVLSETSLMELINVYLGAIDSAGYRNFDKWPIHGVYIWPNQFFGNSYEEDIAYMKQWILDRIAWMDANMPGVTCVTSDGGNLENTSLVIMAKPNPSIGQINLEIQNPLQQRLWIEVTNLTGQVVYSESVEHDILFTDNIRLRPGVYIVKATSANTLKTLKVIVQ